MSSIESIRTMIIDHVNEASQSDSITITSEFLCGVHTVFFSLFTDPTQSPETILDFIETFTSEIDEFSSLTALQALISFACFRGLVVRRPEVLNGSWEAVVWVIVKYSFPINAFLTNLPFTSEVNILEFITEFNSPELCPNPQLRLELLRFIKVFNCDVLSINRESFREKIINTVCESCEKYISFSIDQVPKVQPFDLEYVMRHFEINMRYLTDNYDFQFRHLKIIPAFLKISRKFALLGKETEKYSNNPENGPVIWIDGILNNMYACLSFCGIMTEDYQPLYKECIEDMIRAAGNDFDLQNYVIDIYQTLVKIRNPELDHGEFSTDLACRKETLYNGFSKVHAKLYPFFQYMYEMDGGPEQAEKYRLTHFQENVTGEFIDTDTDSESVSSNHTNMSDHSYTSSDSGSEETSDQGGLMQLIQSITPS